MAVRNRPRGSIAKDDFTDELNLWNSVVERIKKCQSISDKYEEVAGKIPQAEKNLAGDDATANLAALELLSNYHRECLKLSESELKILTEEPDDLIRNLETLISVRTAMEADIPAPRERHHAGSNALSSNPSNPKQARSFKRKLDAVNADGITDSIASTPVPVPTEPAVTTSSSSARASTPQVIPPLKKVSRSGSVVSTATTTKAEQTSDTDVVKGVASTSTATTTPTGTIGSGQAANQPQTQKLLVGSEVFYRQKSKDKLDEGEGIICTITNIMGDGKQRRYEVQDTEPDDNGQIPPPIRATIQSIVAIPISNAGLPPLQKGKTVFARYPMTNTFYKADVVGRTVAGRKDMCRLRFEGEEDVGTEKEVERRYVLEMKTMIAT